MTGGGFGGCVIALCEPDSPALDVDSHAPLRAWRVSPSPGPRSAPVPDTLSPGRQSADSDAAACDVATSASRAASARPSSMESVASCTPGGQIVHPADHHEGGRRIEDADVTIRPALASEHRADGPGVERGVAAAQVVHGGRGEAQGGRVDPPLGELEGAGAVAVELEHGGGRGHAELVQPVVGVDDHGAPASGRPEHGGHDRGHGRIVDAHQLMAGPGRIGQGAEEVEDGRARRARAGSAPRSAWRDGSAGRSRIRCPPRAMQRATPTGPISMATPSASSTSAEPTDDEADRPPCLHTVTPHPATINEARVVTLILLSRSPPVPTRSTTPSRPVGQVERHRRRHHGPGQAGHLGDGLALGVQQGEEGADLRRRGLAGQAPSPGSPRPRLR